MKIHLLALALLWAGLATAQNPYIAVEGAMDRGDGLTITTPRTFVAVDVTVERDVTISGPYARYAQKFLGVSATLADKTLWRITGAELGLVDGTCHIMAAIPASDEVRSVHYAASEDEFARLQPDKMEMLTSSLEDSARQAATTIFALRRNRMELVTGEAGENVFGEGLARALEEIDRLEQSYLELFLGKRVITTQTRRYVVTPEKSKTQYIVCRFSASAGLLPANDLTGDVVLLQLSPSDTMLDETVVAGPKESNYVTCRVADETLCTLSYDRKELVQKVLPVMEFGRTVNIRLQRRR